MSTTVAPAQTQILPTQTTSSPKVATPSVVTNNVSNSTPATIATEFIQAIDDSFQVIGQTYDLTDNKEVFDFVRQTLIERFTHVKPREVKVQAPGGKSGGKGRNKKVPYNLYISHRFAENKKAPTGESTTELMTKFSKEWKGLTVVQKQPFVAMADQQNAKLFPDKVGKQKAAPRAMSGYNLYLKKHSSEFKTQYPELKSAERMTKIGAAWKALSKPQQATYKQEAIAMFHAEHPEIVAQQVADAAAAQAAAQAVANATPVVVATPTPTVIEPKATPVADA